MEPEYLFVNPSDGTCIPSNGWDGAGWYFRDIDTDSYYGPYATAMSAKLRMEEYYYRLNYDKF
jgi:hypothetical protein